MLEHRKKSKALMTFFHDTHELSTSPMVNKKLILMYKKISMLDLSKLTHDFLLRSELDSQNPKTYNKTVKGRG